MGGIVQWVKEGLPTTSGSKGTEKSEGIPTVYLNAKCYIGGKNGEGLQERLRKGALKELDDQLGELGQLEPAGAGTGAPGLGAPGLCGWENICKKEFCPESQMFFLRHPGLWRTR